MGGNWYDDNNTEDEDYAFALQLSEYASSQDNNNNDKARSEALAVAKKPLSVIDPSWELIDPVPDIRELFLQFNDAYFGGRVACVEVKWSPRMTSCAGICRYEGRGGLCCIGLSTPLLKLRPRSDLVNTLLHEMIHALLFVTNNNRDRDGHGEEFHKHMYRINKESGSKITVYHTFHDEVNLYRTHWWKCEGPCAKRHPFYGIVRRSMNRAPGPSDRWWADHQKTCGGVFKKIKEPDKVESKKGKSKSSDKDNTKLDKGKGKAVVTPKKDFFKPTTKQRDKESSVVTKVEDRNTDILKSSSFWNNSSTTSNKVNSFQGLIEGKSEPSQEVFSGSSDSSSGNVHGFKMTARKHETLKPVSFSGKGVAVGGNSGSSATWSSGKGVAVNGSSGFAATSSSGKITSKKDNKTGSSSSSSFGSRESFLKKIENDISKKRKTETVGSSDKPAKRAVEENRDSISKKQKTDKEYKRPRLLSDNNSPVPTIAVVKEDNPGPSRSFKPKSRLSSDSISSVDGIIHIDDSADDELLSGIDNSFLSGDANLVECPACPAKIPEHKLNEHLDQCLA